MLGGSVPEQSATEHVRADSLGSKLKFVMGQVVGERLDFKARGDMVGQELISTFAAVDWN